MVAKIMPLKTCAVENKRFHAQPIVSEIGIFRQLRPKGKILEGATMSRIARRCTLFRFAVLLLWPPLFGQSTPPATQPTTFNISGAITGGRSFAVLFEGASSKTVMTNEAGVYEANLPLGIWTMTVFAHGPDGKIFTNMIYYRRPPFRVTKPTSLVFDISLPQGMFCTVIVIGRDGGPPTQEERDHVKATCAGEEFFSVPSDSVPFEVHVWGGSKFAACSLVGDHSRQCAGEEFFSVPSDSVPFEVHVWGGSKFAACSLVGDHSRRCKRAFATYNTLSVQADDITYDPGESILEAHGNVVTQDESGKRKAPSMIFYVHDGQAIPMQQDR